MQAPIDDSYRIVVRGLPRATRTRLVALPNDVGYTKRYTLVAQRIRQDLDKTLPYLSDYYRRYSVDHPFTTADNRPESITLEFDTLHPLCL